LRHWTKSNLSWKASNKKDLTGFNKYLVGQIVFMKPVRFNFLTS